MKLSHLQVVIAVSELGSLRAASRHLGIAQPAITRSIRDAETELGATLFDRHSRGVRITPMGEAFVRRAISVQNELRRAQEEIDQLKGQSKGQVSIAVSAAANIALLPNALNYFHKRYPNALVRVSGGLFQSVEPDIKVGKCDFYVGVIDKEITSTRLNVKELFDNERVIIARKGHPLEKSNSISELKNARWVRPSLAERYDEADFDSWFESQDLPKPKIVVHSQSTLATMLAVANSDLLTILPKQWLEFPMTKDYITALAIGEAMKAAPISIVQRRDFPLTPLAEHLYHQFCRAAANYAQK